VIESVVLPPLVEEFDMSISEKYRLRALSCENLGHIATDFDIQCAWSDIAIEWHALANRMAQEFKIIGNWKPRRAPQTSVQAPFHLTGPF
jgi:hypothetical protein